jgi:hypothetical protein
MAAGAIMDGARGGIDVPHSDIDRVKSHRAKYYKKMDESPPRSPAADQTATVSCESPRSVTLVL